LKFSFLILGQVEEEDLAFTGPFALQSANNPSPKRQKTIQTKIIQNANQVMEEED
jgi:hypothetical protein